LKRGVLERAGIPVGLQMVSLPGSARELQDTDLVEADAVALQLRLHGAAGAGAGVRCCGIPCGCNVRACNVQ
jgi:hypothetical protein